jgi:bromodomain-containing protein 7
MEKGGPPYAADGSLDFAESGFRSSHCLTCTKFSVAVEDPFSILSALVPDPLCAPLLTPLSAPPARDSPQIDLPLPINVPPPKSLPAPPAPAPQPAGSTKYRHWTIIRSAPPRGKVKETAEERPPSPEWRKPRPLHTSDFGLFPVLATSPSLGGATEVLGTQEQLFEALYTTLENATPSETSVDRAVAAQNWLREVVFGGFDGLAYMRSVAEFVTPSPTTSGQGPNPALAGYVDATLIDELTERRHRAMEAALKETNALGQNSPVTSISQPPFVPPTPLDLGDLFDKFRQISFRLTCGTSYPPSSVDAFRSEVYRVNNLKCSMRSSVHFRVYVGDIRCQVP